MSSKSAGLCCQMCLRSCASSDINAAESVQKVHTERPENSVWQGHLWKQWNIFYYNYSIHFSEMQIQLFTHCLHSVGGLSILHTVCPPQVSMFNKHRYNKKAWYVSFLIQIEIKHLHTRPPHVGTGFTLHRILYLENSRYNCIIFYSWISDWTCI